MTQKTYTPEEVRRGINAAIAKDREQIDALKVDADDLTGAVDDFMLALLLAHKEPEKIELKKAARLLLYRKEKGAEKLAGLVVNSCASYWIIKEMAEQ